MSRLHVGQLSAVFFCCLAASTCANAATVTILQPVTGYTYSFGSGINTAGDVIGDSAPGYAFGNATLWSGSTTQSLSPLAGFRYSRGTSLNDNGVVVGVSQTGDGSFYQGSGTTQATQWTGTTATALTTPNGYTSSAAYDINKDGVVVGASTTSNGPSQATMWTGNTVVALTNISGATSSLAVSINDVGQIAGATYNSDGSTQATIWADGAVTALGNLAGSSQGAGADINHAGDVVGYTRVNNGNTVATVWHAGTATALGAMDGSDNSSASAINDDGLIVGISGGSATLWVNGKALNLNAFLSKSQFSAGWQLAQALDINNQGQITGFARNSMGYTAAFVLSAVPEPTTWSIFALGLIGMGAAVRLNKRAS